MVVVVQEVAQDDEAVEVIVGEVEGEGLVMGQGGREGVAFAEAAGGEHGAEDGGGDAEGCGGDAQGGGLAVGGWGRDGEEEVAGVVEGEGMCGGYCCRMATSGRVGWSGEEDWFVG